MPRQNSKKTKLTFAQRLQKPIPIHPIIALVVVLSFAGLGTYTITESSAATGCTYNTYYEGYQYGHCMRDAQQMLNAAARYTGGYRYLAIDGDFGPQTETDVIKVQQYTSHQYGTAVDGVLGPQTWRQVCRLGIAANIDASRDADCARFE